MVRKRMSDQQEIRISAALRGLRQEPVPATLLPRLLTAVRAQGSAPRPWWVWTWLLLVTTGASPLLAWTLLGLTSVVLTGLTDVLSSIAQWSWGGWGSALWFTAATNRVMELRLSDLSSACLPEGGSLMVLIIVELMLVGLGISFLFGKRSSGHHPSIMKTA